MSQESDESSENAKVLKRENEIDFRELISVLWRGKLWIISTTFFAATISVIFSLWLPNIYRAESLLATDEAGGGLSSLAAQYSGLASLAGLSLPTSESNTKAIGIAKLQSRQFVANFVERHNILPDLMAVERFDIHTGEIGYDGTIYDPISQSWTRDVQPPLKNKPSSQEATSVFQGILDVTENAETGFVSVSIEHLSPVIASQWVTWLIDDLNQELMLEAVEEAQQSIDYLTEQLANTQLVALEQVFYSLIEEQMQTIMLANSRPEYLFKTIDPAIIPEAKYSPNRALICILGTFLGGIIGVLGLLTRRYISQTARNI